MILVGLILDFSIFHIVMVNASGNKKLILTEVDNFWQYVVVALVKPTCH